MNDDETEKVHSEVVAIPVCNLYSFERRMALAQSKAKRECYRKPTFEIIRRYLKKAPRVDEIGLRHEVNTWFVEVLVVGSNEDARTKKIAREAQLWRDNRPVWDATEVLAYLYSRVRHQSTLLEADVAYMLVPLEGKKEELRQELLGEVEEEDWAKASDAVVWFNEQDASKSAHFARIKKELSSYLTLDHLGTAIDAVTAYDRKDTPPPPTQFRAGTKVQVDVSVLSCAAHKSPRGTSQILKFLDDQNNCYVWFTSKGVRVRKDDRLQLSGRVKKMMVFGDRKEVVLERCSIVEL